jgi:four helix bundle protein
MIARETPRATQRPARITKPAKYQIALLRHVPDARNPHILGSICSMTYKRFEDLPVWKSAIDVLIDIYRFIDTSGSIVRRRSDLKSQLERAALSISNNIAEGFERGSTNELISFLYIARGSAGEVRSVLCVLDILCPAEETKSQISDLKSKIESISRQLRAWMDSLQNSDIKGQRHLNDVSRVEYVRGEEAKRQAAERREFMDEIKRTVMDARGF